MVPDSFCTGLSTLCYRHQNGGSRPGGRSHYVLYSRPPVLDSVTPTVSSCYLGPLLERAFFLGSHICPLPPPAAILERGAKSGLPAVALLASYRGPSLLGSSHLQHPLCEPGLELPHSLGVHRTLSCLVLSEMETGPSAFLFKRRRLFFLGNPESFRVGMSDFRFRTLKREMGLQVASMTKSCTLS